MFKQPANLVHLGKLGAYREVIARQAYGNDLGIRIFVLTVTNDRQRQVEIMRKFSASEPNPTFLFKVVDTALLRDPVPGLLIDPWERPGLAPLHIDA